VAGSAVLLVGTLILTYVVSQFLRGSVAVIAPDLAHAVGLTAYDLGLLSSVFFFGFAAAQLPLGMALDRFGARVVLVVCTGILVLGTALFAVAQSADGLIAGRALMGLGASSSFMASLSVYARRFPPDRFASITGLHYGIGSSGSLLATAPLAWAVAAVGWRGSFLAVAALTVVTGVLVAIVVRDEGAAGPERDATQGTSAGGIMAVLRTPSVGRLFIMHVTAYSSFALFVGLWGGPYLSDIYGLGLKERGELLLIPAVAQMFAAFCWGPMDRVFDSYKGPVLTGAVATLLVLAALAAFAPLPLPLMMLWMALLGVASAFTPVLIGHGKSLFAPHLIGRGLSLLNVGSMGGVFLAQYVSGLVIDLFPSANGAYPIAAYRCVFALQAVFVVVAIGLYLGARDPRRAKPVL
jgi:predicted MFS family arabinose efflux permease